MDGFFEPDELISKTAAEIVDSDVCMESIKCKYVYIYIYYDYFKQMRASNIISIDSWVIGIFKLGFFFFFFSVLCE